MVVLVGYRAKLRLFFIHRGVVRTKMELSAMISMSLIDRFHKKINPQRRIYPNLRVYLALIKQLIIFVFIQLSS